MKIYITTLFLIISIYLNAGIFILNDDSVITGKIINEMTLI